ncbi:MAG: spheroidene monooxygenase [Betaproteobacteria bacterium]|nr:spheroidene monooxygenase [Betaproteobacteria bacterium]
MSTSTPPDIAVVVLMEYRTGLHLLWGWGRFLFGRFALQRWPGLRFAKVMGSGHEGGFGLRPSFSRQGLFCVFAGHEAADAFLASDWLRQTEPHLQSWRWLKLEAYASRGRWSGHEIRASASPPVDEPVVSLTRASIRWSQTRRFWRMAPPAEAALAQATGCSLSVGLGEAPVLRQATLSVWDSVAAMNAYARSGAHEQAIRTAYSDRHFSESMFVRWRLLGQGGHHAG